MDVQKEYCMECKNKICQDPTNFDSEGRMIKPCPYIEKEMEKDNLYYEYRMEKHWKGTFVNVDNWDIIESQPFKTFKDFEKGMKLDKSFFMDVCLGIYNTNTNYNLSESKKMLECHRWLTYLLKKLKTPDRTIQKLFHLTERKSIYNYIDKIKEKQRGLFSDE